VTNRSHSADALVILLEASPDAVVAVDSDGIVVMASPAVKALFGFDTGEIVGQPVELLVPEESRLAHERHRHKYFEQATPRPMGLGLELIGRRRDGSLFPIDVSLAPFSSGGEVLVGAFVRDATERRRHEARLRAITEITEHLLVGEPTETTLELVARRARGLVDAQLGWVVVTNGDGDLVISAADGEGASTVIGAHIPPETSISKRAMAACAPILLDDLCLEPGVPEQVKELGLGPGLYCPLNGGDRIVGVLVVARGHRAPIFSASDVALVEVFANAAAVALVLGDARLDLERLQAASEHERIGRDLHDTVIQRLFALGMGLQSIQRLTSGPVAEHIDRVVDGLDDVIRDIRHTIFHLERSAMGDSGVRSAVIEVAAAATEQLGFHPRMGFQGPVDSATSEDLRSQVVAVLTEALSNVARHAKASAVEVVVAAEDGMLVLSVADNGIGPPKGRTAGNGLRNIAERAHVLSGSVSISERNPSGTLLEWRVPLAL
jgi:PAS domain S-box-containing protein